MDEQAQFEKHAHDALAHLYDLPYLDEHPLARRLTPVHSSETPGRVLRRLLLEAIQDLKPPPDSPVGTRAASRYQFLYLRYVRGESVDQIARQLCLSERQLYRRQREALESVTATLARKLQPAPESEPPRKATEPPPSSPATDGEDVQAEVDRIGTARPAAPTDLVQVLRGALATVGKLMQTDGQPISVEVAPDLRPVLADRVAIRQAILGLLIFAIDASGGGAIRVAVGGEDARVSLRIQVRPEPGREDIERPGDDSNLAVSRRLVELQGGALTLLASGQALEMAVSLPAARPKLVLVVDDNADTLQLFTHYLEAQAYRVVTACTGEEALRVVAEKRPDAVVLDVMLPSADGYEVLQSLRSDSETAGVPVLVCTVLKQRELALSLGATEFLPKPATQGDLLAALDRCWS